MNTREVIAKYDQRHKALAAELLEAIRDEIQVAKTMLADTAIVVVERRFGSPPTEEQIGKLVRDANIDIEIIDNALEELRK